MVSPYNAVDLGLPVFGAGVIFGWGMSIQEPYARLGVMVFALVSGALMMFFQQKVHDSAPKGLL